MALAGATFGLLIALSISVIIFSSMVLGYAGYINQKGSDEQKRAKPTLRKWLIWVSAVLLALAATTFIVAIVLVAKGARRGAELSALAARM